MQNKIRLLCPISRKSPIIEEELTESRALDAFQKLLRNNLVSVHTDAIQGNDKAGMFCKRLHSKYPLRTVILSEDADNELSGNRSRRTLTHSKHQSAARRSPKTSLLKLPIPNIRKVPRNGRRRRHHRTHQMSPPA